MHKVGPGLLALRIEYSLRDSHRAPSVTLDGPSSPLATTRSFEDMTGLAALRTCPVRQFIDMHGQLMTLTVTAVGRAHTAATASAIVEGSNTSTRRRPN